MIINIASLLSVVIKGIVMKIGLILSPINFSPGIFYRVESSYLRIPVIIDNPYYSIKFISRTAPYM